MPSGLRILAAAVLLPLAASATDCRFTLADQSNYSANFGFYMDLKNAPVGASTTCQLQNMIVALGVANGSQWQFIVANPAWALNHNYTAKAVITPAYFELYLDGQLLGHIASGFTGISNQDLLANSIPSWAAGAGNYLIAQSSLDAAVGGVTTVSENFAAVPRPIPLMLLAPGALSESTPFQYAATGSLTLTAVFSLTTISANPQTYAPYVDTYGQSVYSSFAGKIAMDSDLHLRRRRRANHAGRLGRAHRLRRVGWRPQRGLAGRRHRLLPRHPAPRHMVADLAGRQSLFLHRSG